MLVFKGIRFIFSKYRIEVWFYIIFVDGRI